MYVVSERAVPFSILAAQFICLIPRRCHRPSYPRVRVLYMTGSSIDQAGSFCVYENGMTGMKRIG